MLDDVQQVCAKLATTPRREGETAFPPLGNIVEELKAQKAAREHLNTSAKLRASDMRALWDHLQYQSELFHKSKQEILDEIKKPGYIGLHVEDVERWQQAATRTQE